MVAAIKLLILSLKLHKMIKVLRIINRFNIGGPTYNATFLTRYLSEDFETLLVGGLPEEGEADSLYITEQYGVHPTLIPEMKRTPNLKSDYQAYKKLKQIIEEFQPQIVHTHAAKAGALGRMAAKSCGVPIILHTFHGHVFHDYFGAIKTFAFKTIEQQLAQRSTGIIAISDLQKNELSELYHICPKEKIQVIPLGFDLTRFYENREENRKKTREKYHLNDETVAIAIIGRLAPIKNHAFFLDVVERVLKSEGAKNLRFFIVGDGESKEEIETRVEQINAHYPENPIVMTSWIRDIPAFNPAMDIICLTSKNEGTPVSLIEAQASGVPVVSTNVGGVKDILLEGETGFVVENKEEFTKKVLFLVRNKNIREKMSQNGWSFVKDKFHYTRLVANTENYYRELLKMKGLL